jgi:hypothetical protein
MSIIILIFFVITSLFTVFNGKPKTFVLLQFEGLISNKLKRSMCNFVL